MTLLDRNPDNLATWSHSALIAEVRRLREEEGRGVMGSWRVGRKVGRTIYDADTDTLIGMMDTAWLAERAVRAVNSHVALVDALEAARQWIGDDTCHHDDERHVILRRIDAVILSAKAAP